MKHLLVYAATKKFNVFYACHRTQGAITTEKKIGGCKDRNYTQIYDMTLDTSAECHDSKKNKQIIKTLSLLETRCPAYMQSASTSAMDTHALYCACAASHLHPLGTRDLYCTCAKCWSLLPIFLRHDFKEVNCFIFTFL